MKTLLIILCVSMALFILYKSVQNIERAFCVFKFRQIPFVPSAHVLRHAVINEIQTQYPHAKTVMEIGAGYGGFARQIAGETNATVYAIENMPFSFAILRTCNFILRARTCIAIRADAFEYIRNMHKGIDIGIAYLGPEINNRLKPYAKRFRVLITLDAPIRGMRPTRTVDLSRHGATRWNGVEYPHKLFIYES
jgi:hypothetical protein